MSEPGKTIDVHSHYLTPRYREEAEAAGHSQPDGFVALPEWEAAAAVETMDRRGIATSMLSVSSPGIHFGDDAAARALARHVNDEGAATVAAHPGRFGLFASLPLPDLDEAIQELDYALDELGADGVVLQTSNGGVHLGDPGLDPLFAELNRRRAVVFIHPCSPPCWKEVSLGFPRPMLEFMFETTRAVTNLVLKGARRRFPDIEIIVPHAGATVPILADRIAAFTQILGLAEVDSMEEVIETLAGFWYDLAGFTERQLPALLRLVDSSRLLYGSDWPFTPEEVGALLAAGLAQVDDLSAEEKTAMFTTNATRLLPRLAGHQDGRR
jgi:predicted TIM-barrel fold metal-dependent hydrolase